MCNDVKLMEIYCGYLLLVSIVIESDKSMGSTSVICCYTVNFLFDILMACRFRFVFAS